MKKKTVLAMLIILPLAFILIGLIGGCGQQGTERETLPAGVEENGTGPAARPENRDGGPLIVRLEGGDWGYPSPYAHYSRGPGIFKMRYLFDSLLEKDEEGYIPWLAEDWEQSEDGKTVIFNIRRDVKWHDGEEFTAHDVAFSFHYYQKHPPVFIRDILLDGDFLIEAEALSDYQVKLTTSAADATFLYEAGTARIIPQHIWEDVDDPQNYLQPEAVIGCGPYRLTDYEKEHGTYRFEAFEQYWGPTPRVDVIEFIPVSDPVLAFEKGEIAIAEIPPDILPRFQDKPDFEILEKPGFWGYRLIFNMEKVPLFKKSSFREALAYAIDRQELVDKAARGAAIPGNPGILSRHHIWYNPAVPEYPYDPGLAAKMLTGLDLAAPLSLRLLLGGDVEVRIGEILKEQLGRAGIELKVESVDLKSRDARISEGQYEMALLGHGGWGGDPDYLRARFASDEAHWVSGTPGYKNPRVEELCRRQIRETNPARRKELIFELQQLLAEDVPEIPLYNTTGYFVYRPEDYDGWMFMFDHHDVTHSKLSFLER